MEQKTFKAALKNNLALSACTQPQEIELATAEWLIVTRSGEQGKFLTISDTQSVDDDNQVIPDPHVPDNTMYGVLLRENDNEAIFRLIRHLRAGHEVRGDVFSVDGYARISKDGDGIKLTASGRHTCREENYPEENMEIAATFLHDIPTPNSDDGMAWQLENAQPPWSDMNQFKMSSVA